MIKNAEILEKMTLEEKAALCDGADFWHLKSFSHLGLDKIMVCDGPHGLRKQDPEHKKVGLGNSVPAVCFPTACATASSWDPELLYEMGEALGDKCLAEGVSVILGPGVNMKRSPLCGRNFEYFSEDPMLAGELATGLINGVQSKGVGTSLKHFAANSQETRRMTVSDVVDERTLREIYLPAFEAAVKNAKPWTVMNAYNRINGTYCSENEWLQTKVLRDEWGFDGLVVSDWGAVNDRVEGIKAGNDLEMPSSKGFNTAKIIDAVKNGTLDEAALDKCADRVISLILKSTENKKKNYAADEEAQHQLARKIAANSMVLLKNEGNILPLKKNIRLAVIGEMAVSPRFQGAGSSLINPTKTDCAVDSLLDEGYDLKYCRGYKKSTDKIDSELMREAVAVSSVADTVIVFAGLTEDFESEGFDREHLNMPHNQNELIKAIAAVNKNIIIVLAGGAPVSMPWHGSVKAILNSYLGGQAGAGAVADIISGKVNPSGKLAETYPICNNSAPCKNYFPGNTATVEYRESIYIGYRYYEKAQKKVRFPFGFGLSYTTFEYSALKLGKKKIKDTDELTVSFTVKNTGAVDGAEIAQIYVADKESTIFRPEKELKAFKKVFLKAGEETKVTVTLGKRAFAYYNINISDWHVESGEFDILVGASSADIRLSACVNVESTAKDVVIPDYRETAPCYYTGKVQDVPSAQFEALIGHEIPPAQRSASEPVDVTSCIEDAGGTKWGGRINKTVNFVAQQVASGVGMSMGANIAVQTPIRSFISMSGGLFSPEMADGLIKVLNDDEPGKGVSKIAGGVPHLLKNLKEFIKTI